MPDLQFFAEIDSFMAEFVAQAEAFAPNIAGQVLEEIIDTGPYWSGRSKASWVTSVGEPVFYVAEDVAKKANALSAEDAKQRSMATLANIQNAPLGQTIIIANGNPYIDAINSGHSPGYEGWIDAAVNRFLGTLNVDVYY